MSRCGLERTSVVDPERYSAQRTGTKFSEVLELRMRCSMSFTWPRFQEWVQEGLLLSNGQELSKAKCLRGGAWQWMRHMRQAFLLLSCGDGSFRLQAHQHGDAG